MVSVNENVFQLRDYYLSKLIDSSQSDPFKSQFLVFLGLIKSELSFDINSLSLYQKCTVAGLKLSENHSNISNQELLRLLGQAPKIDSTPMPWVTDIYGVMSVKWLANKQQSDEIDKKLKSWAEGFLLNSVYIEKQNTYESDLVIYILGKEENKFFSSACIPLFLHYNSILIVNDHKERKILADRFFHEFQDQYQNIDSLALLSIMVFVFDNINGEVTTVPSSGWSHDDLLKFLKDSTIGLKRWTWEDKGRTQGAQPVKWFINNEYHVQNLLYVLLAPVFNDISDEVYLSPLGQKTPRIDLYLPSMHTIIEVKYRKNTNKSFQAFIGEIGEDVSLYRADPAYENARIVSFLWDHTRASQEHTKFIEGVMKIRGMDGCVVISSPSMIE